MAKSAIMVELDDPRTDKIASAISNKTSKKILALLAEKEMSEGDIANALGMPINTVGYNIKNLVESGLIDRSGKYFWSRKGKKIILYRVSNKRIVISPKSMIKGVMPAVFISLLVALVLYVVSINYSIESQKIDKFDVNIAQQAEASVSGAQDEILNDAYDNTFRNAWAWFLLGALSALLIYLIWNYFGK